MTQAIRLKLQFNDEARWKKFSARRLELIDDLGLSTKKASEQEDRIAFVADSLREEYGFPRDTLGDFDKLVRAGIQSVRRNRKRSRNRTADDDGPNNKKRNLGGGTLGRDSPSTGTIVRSESQSPQNETRMSQLSVVHTSESEAEKSSNLRGSVTPVTGIVASAGTNTNVSTTDKSPAGALAGSVGFGSSANNGSGDGGATLPSINFITSVPKNCDHFTMAVERLAGFVAKTSLLTANGNTEFMGASVLNAAAAHAVDRICSLGTIKYTSPSSLRDCMLGYTVTSALVRSLGLVTLASLNLALATCSREYGFDVIILSLSNIYWEMINLEPYLDFGKMTSFKQVASAFYKAGSYRTAEGAGNLTSESAPSPSSKLSSLNRTPSRSKPVAVKFADQSLQFTYTAPLDPLSSSGTDNSPPTLAELLDNCRTAFGIAPSQVVYVVASRNREGDNEKRDNEREHNLIVSDEDLARIFLTYPQVDLELSLLPPANRNVSRPSPGQPQPQPSNQHHHRHHENSLPPLLFPNYQQLA